MNTAKLIFTKFPNSFKVHVENLEELSVSEIQVLETFVSVRNGVFDFNTYTFVVPKRLEFHDFVLLLEHINIKAKCKEYIIEVKSQPRVGFGQYKGMQYNELPDSYMLWLKSNYRGYDRDTIEKELKRRKL